MKAFPSQVSDAYLAPGVQINLIFHGYGNLKKEKTVTSKGYQAICKALLTEIRYYLDISNLTSLEEDDERQQGSGRTLPGRPGIPVLGLWIRRTSLEPWEITEPRLLGIARDVQSEEQTSNSEKSVRLQPPCVVTSDSFHKLFPSVGTFRERCRAARFVSGVAGDSLPLSLAFLPSSATTSEDPLSHPPLQRGC